ncbi:hypothetical protein E3N88_14105 [Mikania micrantha]|uniref:Uncharacterized protein n=1 Tax=Mikania micrantha TaxID=192012 RepID=A0A5N6P3M1_9ASTR|nr:hypothetical protein E3N88_14105 [Mikania micrantha]
MTKGATTVAAPLPPSLHRRHSTSSSPSPLHRRLYFEARSTSRGDETSWVAFDLALVKGILDVGMVIG